MKNFLRKQASAIWLHRDTQTFAEMLLQIPEVLSAEQVGECRKLLEKDNWVDGRITAGHLILYPASSLHHVRPVTRGARLASFYWIQSMVRDDGERTLLFDLDVAIQRLTSDVPDHHAVVELTSLYHNLLRRWAHV